MMGIKKMVRSIQQMIFKTEGVVATLIFNLLFKSDLENPFDKLLQVMVAHKPMTFFDFINAFVDEFPDVKTKVIRQFLESTRYVTVSHDAPEFYKQKYQCISNTNKRKSVTKTIRILQCNGQLRDQNY